MTIQCRLNIDNIRTRYFPTLYFIAIYRLATTFGLGNMMAIQVTINEIHTAIRSAESARVH